MTAEYRPDDAARLQPPWTTAFLSQRDLGLQVPIDFVTGAGVVLSQACFGKSRYEDGAASKCLSNLLATGFRKIVVDLYWDTGRRTWSLCPAQVPRSTESNAAASTSRTEAPPSSTASFSTINLSGRGVVTSSAFELTSSWPGLTDATTHSNLVERQLMSSGSTTTLTSSSAATDTPGNAASGSSTVTNATLLGANATGTGAESSVPIYQIGPYQCTSTIDLPVITSILAQFLRTTSTNLDASLVYLILNLHAAASLNNPSSPAFAPEPANLPVARELISDIISVDLSTSIYTPRMLRDDRANLNSSWYNAADDNRPDFSYYVTQPGPNKEVSTESGWPTENYIEQQRYLRLIAGIGTIDPQMQDYDSSADTDTIFPSGYTFSAKDVSYRSADEGPSSGCLFDPQSTALERVNSSWATTTDVRIASGINETISSIADLTACGISPVLNETLQDNSADNSTSVSAYRSVALGAIWSWAQDEPRYTSSTGSDIPLERCASTSVRANGRWSVSNCDDPRYAACRAAGRSPYEWLISEDRHTYTSSASACASNASFSVPQTALENAYLLSAMQKRFSADSDASVWLNFNSIAVTGCWVSGVNATCRWSNNGGDTDKSRTVVVPTVAAVIVFVLAGLTVFVKCAANRRNERGRRRRRKVDESWEYEGVPS